MNESEKIYRKYEVAISFLERENVSLDTELQKESTDYKQEKVILRKIKANNKKVVLLNAQKEKELDEYYDEKRFNDLMDDKKEIEATKLLRDTKHYYKGFEIIRTTYNSEGSWVLGGRHYVEGGVKRNYNIKKDGVFVINPNTIFSTLKYTKEYIDDYLIKKVK